MFKEEITGFLEDTSQALESIEQILMNHEALAEDSGEILSELLRYYHSIKGTAAFFEFRYLESICHVCEDILVGLKHHSKNITPELADSLLLTLDRLHRICEQIQEHGKEVDFDHSDLLVELMKFEQNDSPTQIVETDNSEKGSGNWYQLIYLSVATKLFDTTELVALLCKARDKNRVNNVSGMLIYRDEFFLQVLEGKKSDVIATYDRIKSDPRHKHIAILGQQHISQRSFPNWSMGFHHMKALEKAEIDGLNQTVNKDEWPELIPGGIDFVPSLMRSFRDNTEVR